MSRRVLLRAPAEAEIKRAYAWHEDTLPGLSESFLERFDDAVATLADDAQQHAVLHGRIRRLLLRRFPYAVWYVVEGEVVTVLGVFHASRDPVVWRGL